MNADKTCFIHIRPRIAADRFISKGGYTLAWKITSEGAIEIGIPAICVGSDHYVKSVGRGIATRNLAERPPVFVIPADHVREAAVNQALQTFNPAAFTLATGVEIKEFITKRVSNDPLSTMTSNWFEALVHSTFVLNAKNTEWQLIFANDTKFRVQYPVMPK